MRQLAWVQIFSWAGLFCMFLYFPITVAHVIFKAPNQQSPLYAEGIEYAGLCFAFYSLVWFFFSFALPHISKRISRKGCHSLCLLAGALGLGSVFIVQSPHLLMLSMVGVGIAVASIQTLPFAILADVLPDKKMGVFMGIFNLFITIPQILISLGFGYVMARFLNNQRELGVLFGGIFMLIAALLTFRVKDSTYQQTAS
jgi:maltose/moltooligosaccharide transporter